jgi:uncharacterized protein YdhG (YjbR/CyaY superfamily)
VNDAFEGAREVDRYIASFPPDIAGLLAEIREAIRRAAPEAAEKMAYGVPTFHLHGNLVHFAAFKRHVGFYPGPTGIQAFRDEIQPYKHARGSVQFPFTQPLPLELVERIVRFRVEEDRRRAG